jgi:hypothetical protein
MDTATNTNGRVTPWNKGKLLGQKPPLKLKEIWAIRIRLQLGHRARELALFNLAIDSKLRGCDLVGLRVHDVVQGSHVAARAIVMQKKTQRPVQFEITEQSRDAVAAWDHDGPSEAGATSSPSSPSSNSPECGHPLTDLCCDSAMARRRAEPWSRHRSPSFPDCARKAGPAGSSAAPKGACS